MKQEGGSDPEISRKTGIAFFPPLHHVRISCQCKLFDRVQMQRLGCSVHAKALVSSPSKAGSILLLVYRRIRSLFILYYPLSCWSDRGNLEYESNSSRYSTQEFDIFEYLVWVEYSGVVHICGLIGLLSVMHAYPKLCFSEEKCHALAKTPVL